MPRPGFVQPVANEFIGPTVFILGAGASSEAGIPVMRDFLEKSQQLLRSGEAKHAKESIETVLKVRALLQGTHSKSRIDLNNIESVYSLLDMVRILEIPLPDAPPTQDYYARALRKVIATTIEESMIVACSGSKENSIIAGKAYCDLVQLIRAINVSNQKRLCSILTFNYDIACEIACYHWNMKFDYGLDPRALPSDNVNLIPVYKLHGSVNWKQRRGSDKPWIEAFSEIDQFKNREPSITRMLNEPSKFADARLRLNLAETEIPEGDVLMAPFIIPPTWNKGSQYENIAPVWKAAANALHHAENIIVIGMSLPESDAFFKYLYAIGTLSRETIHRFWVYNPDQDVRKRFKAMIGTGVESNFKFFRTDFHKAAHHLHKVLIKVSDFPLNPSLAQAVQELEILGD